MAQRDRSSGDEHPEHAPGRDPAAPIRQSRVATEAAPAARTGDPMASIRPELPASPPLLTPTVQLPGLGDHSGLVSCESDPTAVPPRGPADPPTDSDATSDSGVLVIPVRSPIGPTLDLDGALPVATDDAAAYELLTRIGAGGMGEVWEARQCSLGRPVALKRLHAGRRTPPSVLGQFKSEARLTGVLDHPNIVTVHDLGRDQDGRVFYTMKLIEGTAWSEVIASGRRSTSEGEVVELELRDHLDILLEVGQAIAFAHSRGIIHRDIKPGNVMIGDYGEVLVVDWGLAVALRPLPVLGGAETWTLATLPRSALVCGTPAYMSPETALAKRESIGFPTDVYLLGAVLFHVLYGRPPHKGPSVKAVMSKAKVNGWAFPRKVAGRLEPWDVLLRPVINRALATNPELRFADASEFGDALRRAIRNYDSAKVASRAQEKLAKMDRSGFSGTGGYQSLAALIARLEGALESWPHNVTARQTLAQAHLELANLALANNDLGLVKIGLDNYGKLPPLPEPEPERYSQRLTVHPVDGTLVGAPRPSDSLVAAGTSKEWASSSERLSPLPIHGELARTIGARELASDRRDIKADGTRAPTDVEPRGAFMSRASLASVQIQEHSSESVIDDDLQLKARAVRLHRELGERARGVRRRRVGLWVAGGLASVLTAVALVALIGGSWMIGSKRDRDRQERDQLSKAVLEQTVNTVEAQLELQFKPVHGALMTSARWAAAGNLDVDNPALLNQYFMPLLEGVDVASSTLRADADGHEYMLLGYTKGWRTRSSAPGLAPELRDWTRDGELVELWRDERPYDPRARPWYRGGAALRERARRARLDGNPQPVFWTDPYILLSTDELGVSISTPATSVSGREFVLAFDVSLGAVSRVTSHLPEGIDRGQVFVLDEQLRVLGLPRETSALPPDLRRALLLKPLADIATAPISRAAFLEWRKPEHLDSEDPFGITLEGERYWVGFRFVDTPDRPKAWIGVVVPE